MAGLAVAITCSPFGFVATQKGTSTESSQDHPQIMASRTDVLRAARSARDKERYAPHVSATLPMRTWGKPVRPCVASTIRSMFCLRAYRMISTFGDPSTTAWITVRPADHFGSRTPAKDFSAAALDSLMYFGSASPIPKPGVEARWISSVCRRCSSASNFVASSQAYFVAAAE